jgi:hypothetical protein
MLVYSNPMIWQSARENFIVLRCCENFRHMAISDLFEKNTIYRKLTLSDEFSKKWSFSNYHRNVDVHAHEHML